LILIFSLAGGDLPAHGPLLGVRIQGSPGTIAVEPPEGGCTVRLGSDELDLPQGSQLRVQADGDQVVAEGVNTRLSGEALLVLPVNSGSVTTVRIAGATRRLPGSLCIAASRGALRVVNLVALEDYVRAVVPSEVPATFHPQALRAQAIVARTWALRNRGKHAADGYDFCDATHCQVYRGADAFTPATDAAVSATRGQVITYQGEPIQPVYHSTCGGHTADPEAVWRTGRNEPYLRGVSDEEDGHRYCADSPYAWWKCHLTPQQLAAAAGIQGPVSIHVDERDAEGRVTRLTVRNGRQRRTMTGYEFYLAVARAVGPGRVRSSWFDTRAGGGVTLIGRGYGHGVGMCQWGAEGRARAGQSAEQILHHYYGPDIRIERLD
jgi:stage II sporulation protein D